MSLIIFFYLGFGGNGMMTALNDNESSSSSTASSHFQNPESDYRVDADQRNDRGILELIFLYFYLKMFFFRPQPYTQWQDKLLFGGKFVYLEAIKWFGKPRSGSSYECKS